MTPRPLRPRAALLALTVALGAAGCAGTDQAPAASSTSTSTNAPSESSGVAPSSDAGPREGAGQRLEVQVAGGQATGDTGRVPVALGTAVTVVVTSDVADEAHLHGYDIEAALTPGEPAELTFDATIPGVFELELHETGTVLLTLQVG